MTTKRLIIAPHDPAEFLGGTERVVDAMVRARIRRGEEIVMIAGSERFADAGETESRGEPNLAIHTMIRARNETGEIFLRPRIRADFERIFNTVRPQIVEWHHGATLSLDLVRAAVDRGAKVVMFLHDLWVSCPRFFRIPPRGIVCPSGVDRGACTPCARLDLPWELENVKNWVDHYTEAARFELCAADLRIAPSRSHADTIESYFSDLPLNIQIVPHGLLDSDLPDPPRRLGPAEPGKLRIVHFGNLVPEKGIEDLARAFTMLNHPQSIILDLYGEELAAGFVDKVRGICPQVEIRWHGGYRSFRNIYDRVVASDVAAFPSRAPESYGLVVDEALAAGLPVLVSNRGALRERANGAGAVLAAESPEAWAAEIQQLLDEPAKLVNYRAAVITKRHTIEHAIDQIDALVAALAGC